MPREQIDWLIEGSEQFHAQHCSTYHSVLNVNRNDDPYSKSFEREQTILNESKRYQSSIDNIFLTKPIVFTLIKACPSNGDEQDTANDRNRVGRSVSLLPPVPPSRQHALAIHRLNQTNFDVSKVQHSHSSSKNIVLLQKSKSMTHPMRITHVNGEFVVRI